MSIQLFAEVNHLALQKRKSMPTFISLAILIVLLSYILCYKCTISLDLHFQNHIAVLYKYQLNGGAGKKVCIAIYVLGQHLGGVTC